MFSASEILVLVGGICVIVGFLWVVGLLVGLRLRGTRLPLKGCCGALVLVYFVAVVFVAVHLLRQAAEVQPEETLREVVQEQPLPVAAPGAMQVTRVVDGDTIVVDNHGKEEKIRLLGINTPETVDPRRDDECFGLEASARAEELLEGEWVTLTPDASQDNADRYGRLLRYVTLANGDDVGETLIEEGYAFEYTYKTAYERQSAYRVAETTAKSNALGIWSDLCQ